MITIDLYMFGCSGYLYAKTRYSRSLEDATILATSSQCVTHKFGRKTALVVSIFSFEKLFRLKFEKIKGKSSFVREKEKNVHSCNQKSKKYMKLREFEPVPISSEPFCPTHCAMGTFRQTSEIIKKHKKEPRKIFETGHTAEEVLW